MTDRQRIVLAGLPATRAARMIGHLLGDDVEPERVAQITAVVIDRVFDYPDHIAACIASYASRFGFRRGDGPALLDHLLNMAGYQRNREVIDTLARGR